ncbi:hypothetical protein NCCP1664_01740 [Zafaria cholistanensis]|uniref:Uncharacterized protein n=1 Tax=Zafaria cholistanensis TaxID=1682741 RepID=A0A5A7NNQ3_9MICC|nr:hypothetical protein NCCP1664_01740 [Zafaria cholistanensis]
MGSLPQFKDGSVQWPSDPQRTIFQQIVRHGGALAGILQAQFAACHTVQEEHCEECFALVVAPDVPLLPEGTNCPLGFAADLKGQADPADVLLWHEGGRVTGVEISWYDDPHPPLTKVSIFQRWWTN